MNQTDKYFMFKCRKGLEARLSKLTYPFDKKEYLDRLEYELELIVKMGFSSYFLVVADLISWSKKNHILVGDGRGSAAGSLAVFALGITNVDPIKYDLYFERFLNPGRATSPPDIDSDFQKDRRDEVIEYIKNKYGRDKVAQIGTFGTFKAKAAIKAIARTLNISLLKANVLSKLYPKPLHGKEIKFKDALESVEALKLIYDSDSEEGLILRWAEKIEDRVASFGVHASGIVISDEALIKTVPLAKGKDGEAVTQWDMKNVEDAGLIKFDVLGLKTLSQIAKTLQHVIINHDVDIDIENLPLDDEQTFANLRKGDNVGVFQLEASTGIRDLTMKVRPTSIEDLAVINAAYRPGPLGSSKMEDYLRWRSGEAIASYHHKDLEPILGKTGGWLIYQEQVLRIARDLAGYSLTEADNLRRAVGKKDAVEMQKHYQKLKDGMADRGYSSTLTKILWDEIDAFSAYGFNASHAVAYAITGYKTSYLKTHYPVEFMAATLTCESSDQDQKIIYIQECKRMGIPVLPPDINESGLDFTPKNNTIRFGLAAIKNVGEGAAHIIEERQINGPFKDLFDFTERVDLNIVNKKKQDSLVLSGAFSFTHHNRATLITTIDLISAYKKDIESYKSKLATYEKKTEAAAQRLLDIAEGKLSDKGKKLSPLKIAELPVKPIRPDYQICDEYSKRDLLQQEKELTGSFISGHPLDGLTRKNTTSIKDLKDDEEQPPEVKLLVVISKIELKETKNKQRMAFLGLEDLSGTIGSVIFPKAFRKFESLMLPNIPVIIRAKVEYKDIENEEGSFISIPSLDIQDIELVGTQALSVQESIVDIPLQVDKILELKKSIDKTGPGDCKIRIRFGTKSDTIVSPVNLLSISNERTFKTELYRARKH